jgi:transcriptional regulator with XRE-family HTH domain
MVVVAHDARLTQGFLSRVETGKRMPTLDALERLLGVLDARLEVRLKEDSLTE